MYTNYNTDCAYCIKSGYDQEPELNLQFCYGFIFIEITLVWVQYLYVRDSHYQFLEAPALLVAVGPSVPLSWIESIIATGLFQQNSFISPGLMCLKQTVD